MPRHPHHPHQPHQPRHSFEHRVADLLARRLPPHEVCQLLRELAACHALALAPDEHDPRVLAAALDQLQSARRRAQFEALLANTGPGAHVLAGGECPPPLLDDMLAHDLRITQLHGLRHGAAPPHVSHLMRRWPRYCFADQVEQLVEAGFTHVLVHAHGQAAQWRVAPLAAVAARLWHRLPLIVVQATHAAPHHRVGLDDRSPTLIIEE